MSNPSVHHAPPADERRAATGGTILAGAPCRDDDMEQAYGVHSVARLFRALSVVLVLLMVVQLLSGVTSAIEISYGVLLAEAVRLIIFAGLLWGAGDLADLFVKSHCDLRATRILLGRMSHLAEHLPEHRTPPVDEGDPRRGPGDATH